MGLVQTLHFADFHFEYIALLPVTDKYTYHASVWCLLTKYTQSQFHLFIKWFGQTSIPEDNKKKKQQKTSNKSITTPQKKTKKQMPDNTFMPLFISGH